MNAHDYDSDNDAIPDGVEVWWRWENGSNISVGDIDNDGLIYCAIDPDSDGDNVSDGVEFYEYDGKFDTDCDG